MKHHEAALHLHARNLWTQPIAQQVLLSETVNNHEAALHLRAVEILRPRACLDPSVDRIAQAPLQLGAVGTPPPKASVGPKVGRTAEAARVRLAVAELPRDLAPLLPLEQLPVDLVPGLRRARVHLLGSAVPVLRVAQALAPVHHLTVSPSLLHDLVRLLERAALVLREALVLLPEPAVLVPPVAQNLAQLLRVVNLLSLRSPHHAAGTPTRAPAPQRTPKHEPTLVRAALHDPTPVPRALHGPTLALAALPDLPLVPHLQLVTTTRPRRGAPQLPHASQKPRAPKKEYAHTWLLPLNGSIHQHLVVGADRKSVV